MSTTNKLIKIQYSTTFILTTRSLHIPYGTAPKILSTFDYAVSTKNQIEIPVNYILMTRTPKEKIEFNGK